jgi:aspartate oxidase
MYSSGGNAGIVAVEAPVEVDHCAHAAAGGIADHVDGAGEVQVDRLFAQDRDACLGSPAQMVGVGMCR